MCFFIDRFNHIKKLIFGSIWARKNIKDKSIYYVLNSSKYHIGDAFSIISLFPVYYNVHHTYPGIITDGNSIQSLAKLFKKYVHTVIEIDTENINNVLEYVKWDDRKYVNIKSLIYDTDAYINFKEKTGRDMLRWQLGIEDETVRIDNLSFSCEFDQRINNIMEDRGITSNSVILMPYAKSVTMLPIFVWERLANLFNDAGYVVYTNAIGNEKPIKGTILLSESIEIMVGLSTRVCKVISMQSGLSDLIKWLNLKCDLTVVVYLRTPNDYLYIDERMNKNDNILKISEYVKYICVSREDLGQAEKMIFDEVI